MDKEKLKVEKATIFLKLLRKKRERDADEMLKGLLSE